MIRAILIGLDGSAYSDAALELAIAWARRFDCMLVGVAIVDEPTIRGHEPIRAVAGHFRTAYEDLIEDAERIVEGRLEKFAVRAKAASVRYKALEDFGLPCQEILRESERYDLIMLGQQTYFHCMTKLHESDTLDHILRHATRPVVAVPETIEPGKRILVAYDGSQEAARAVYAFASTGLHRLGDIVVVSVDSESEKKAADTAERAADFLALHEIKAAVRPEISVLPPGRVVLDLAKQLEAQFIVMGAKGKSRFWEKLFGSVTERALDESTVPLFMFH